MAKEREALPALAPADNETRTPTHAPAQAPDEPEAQRWPGAAASAAVAATAALAACGGGGGGGAASSEPEEPAIVPVVTFSTAGYSNLAPANDTEAARFLQQAQFSSTRTEIAALRGEGYPMWLARQFQTPLRSSGWNWLEARGYGANNSHSYYFNTYPADFMIWSQLLSGPDMMRKRCALALSEMFVSSMTSAEFTWRSHAYASWWDMLVRNAFGNFRQLLEDVTLHPAMGWFLNTKGNQKENPATGRVPDENYAREVMQLFTIGLVDLNIDGTPRMSGGRLVESYTQDDVTNLARVFTGWDFDTSDGVRITPPGASWTIESNAFARKPMSLRESRHSTLEARFLGAVVPAGTPGRDALRIAMDTLFNHPNVGPFFARQMIQRLVTSNPSPAYVERVARKFNDNGNGVRGDLQTVWVAILLDDEARGAASLASTSHGKLREPMLRFIQWARTFSVTSAAGSWKIFDLSNPGTQLGQSPLRAPSVFNFFRPGYVPPGTAMAAADATAPEFQIVNESSVGGYLNFMQGAIERGIQCPNPSVPEAAWNNPAYDVRANYAYELSLALDAGRLVDHLSLVLTAGQISPATRAVMVNALEATPLNASSDATARNRRVWAAILMVMGCPEYLIQK
ncbi:DUF1800 domain-containing protein [Hydrogenophaga intermedia]|jgi:uncharacterized protein (DUF1800 family)|uniref:DUF1800 domain-containing protein n=1 Tax=Hydrogenophaga intermedia TaxID=65786 RepID=UPI00204399F2|nr:DUF1800 domain-containing protein [Hydrogenophaga intermedia]MCM3563007.1 DUF1800 domain-containing protein [Hydrogenophaga intermedia]